jgi:putative FmdB family regulatory protein
MPLYEYECREDGTTIELLRPVSQADAPVPDPQGRNRTYVRRMSAFATGGQSGGTASKPGGCCPCGKNKGSCSSQQ